MKITSVDYSQGLVSGRNHNGFLRAKLADSSFTAEELIKIFRAEPKPPDLVNFVSGEDENDD